MSRQATRHLSAVFSDRLRQAQEEEGVKNDALAARTGISVRLIQKYRAADTLPKETNLLKLSKALDRPIGWFFAENGDQP